ncbi:hypothetical protein PHLCEN_2v110 [Hermanssonia centrifuga]|uniref:Uncharacterized protein n=1 Tax=Hermanssonia centrifuga TaxID=98765 RepID=A0A2R6S6Y7_9APHY|nr:hypothetical protein PHLCEN_2v110 [Hermanssonia centrifuga]
MAPTLLECEAVEVEDAPGEPAPEVLEAPEELVGDACIVLFVTLVTEGVSPYS